MPEIKLPYGKNHLTATLPDTWHIEHITPVETDSAPDPFTAVNAALDNPISSKRLSDFTGIERVAIAVNDKTRPVPHAELLPPLLARLEAAGLSPDAITFIIASGTHFPMQPEEYSMILPENIFAKYRVIAHDADDEANLVHMGTTSRGTPVAVNRHYMDADLRIVVGVVGPHQFMGFSGGAKSAAIGLAAKTTIRHNHAMMISDDNTRLGYYEQNPARQDVEEIGRLMGVEFALNALLNRKKQIARVFAGDPVAMMQAAVPEVRQIAQVSVDAPFDLIVASPGGHPKDINLYQTQKALANAALITKTGGTVILVSACPEGVGGKTYKNWMMHESMTSHEAVFERFQREGFQMGVHKAFLFSRDASRVRVLLVSKMDASLVKRFLLNPAASLDKALKTVLTDLSPEARIGVMPNANATIPVLKSRD